MGETGLYVGGVMEELTGSPGSNSSGETDCWMCVKLEILSGFQNKVLFLFGTILLGCLHCHSSKNTS